MRNQATSLLHPPTTLKIQNFQKIHVFQANCSKIQLSFQWLRPLTMLFVCVCGLIWSRRLLCVAETRLASCLRVRSTNCLRLWNCLPPLWSINPLHMKLLASLSWSGSKKDAWPFFQWTARFALWFWRRTFLGDVVFRVTVTLRVTLHRVADMAIRSSCLLDCTL